MRFTKILRLTECLKNVPTVKSPPNAKVIVWGTSHLAQAILLDLKLSPLLEEIRIFDRKENATKLCEDLNHIDTDSVVTPYYGTHQIGCALHDVDVIVLAGGAFPLPGECKHSVFKKNLPILLDMAYECAHHNPTAALVVLTPPGTRNVPMISELYEKIGIPNGGLVMTPMYHLEMMASRVLADHLSMPTNIVSLPVVGGCCSNSIIPLFSRALPQNEFTDCEIECLLRIIRNDPDEVSRKQFGKPPTLAPAMAASKLILDIVRGRFSMPQIPQSVFLRSNCLLNVKYLGTTVEFGPKGPTSHSKMPPLSNIEYQLLAQSVVTLQEDARIAKAAAAAKWNEIE